MSTIKRVSLDEIVAINGLRNKEYLVKEHRGAFKEAPLLAAQLRFTGSKPDTIYTGSEEFSCYDHDRERKVGLDDDGLPYFEESVGPITYQRYAEILLHNTGFGAGMADTSGKLRDQILRKTKKEGHPIYQEFRQYIEKFIRAAPKIKEAVAEKFYFGNEERLKKYSQLYKRLFEDLTRVGGWSVSGDDFDSKNNPDNYDVGRLRLKNVEERAFRIWYGYYMDTHGYDDKVEDWYTKPSQALEKWIQGEIAKLEAVSFARVEIFLKVGGERMAKEFPEEYVGTYKAEADDVRAELTLRAKITDTVSAGYPFPRRVARGTGQDYWMVDIAFATDCYHFNWGMKYEIGVRLNFGGPYLDDIFESLVTNASEIDKLLSFYKIEDHGPQAKKLLKCIFSLEEQTKQMDEERREICKTK